MTHTPGLKQALGSVADAERSIPDPLDDLVRAQAASTARTRRRFRAALGGFAVLAVIGVGVSGALAQDDAGDGPAAATAVRLVATQLDAAPYTFDLTPVGWSVQAQTPTAVTIVPGDGSVSSSPDDFRGKLVILFDNNVPDGRLTSYEGHDIWVSGDSGYVTMAMLTSAGEPDGVVRIQYPAKAGWDTSTMQAFVASVHVGANARPGQG